MVFEACTVGVPEVFQQTPRAVTEVLSVEETEPPLFAPIEVILSAF